MFNLEQAIENWKKQLRKNTDFEDGDIAELESHLREYFYELLDQDIQPDSAFKKAQKEIGSIEAIAPEFHKSKTNKYYLNDSSGLNWGILGNLIKISRRNLIKNKGFSFINITGLSVGLAVCLLIGLYVHHETSYDSFHEKTEQTFRVLREFDLPDLKVTIPTTPPSLATTIEQNITGIEKAVRVQRTSPIIEYESQKYVESSFIFSDPGFFDLFSFPILKGERSLERPNTILITDRIASKYFQNEDPIGKVLKIGSDELEVIGVLANIPSNTHLNFDFISRLDPPAENWGQNGFTTYALLSDGYTKDAIVPQISSLIKTYTDPDNTQTGNDFIPHLQPINDIHLGQGTTVSIGSEGNILYVYLFIALAIFIVILACINFINLSTARSVERAKEVGMRKTLGAFRKQIAGQFLGESLMMAFISLAIALLLSWIFLPYLNELADKVLYFNTLFTFQSILILIGLILFIGIFAGAYPAFILSRFQPTQALKSTVKSEKTDFLRKGLVVFQFMISITLLIGTGVIYKQLNFMKNSGLGFEPNNVLLIKKANFLGNSKNTFVQDISSLTGIKNVTSGYSVPGTFFINSMWQPAIESSEARNMDYSFIDFNYIETLQIEMASGRSFSPNISGDTMSVIINETAARNFGWTPNEALEQKLTQAGREYPIIGVAKDFNFRSLHANIYPLALFGPRRTPRYIAAKLSPEASIPDAIENIQASWNKFSELSFEYSFLADDLSAQYRSEDRLVKVFTLFAGLAILIGCLGLFGLTAFMVTQRTKEIGIRKVLGATVGNILLLISKDIIKLVVIGFAIAVPLGLLLKDKWLQSFAYKTEVGFELYGIAGLLAILVALSIVSTQAIRAALMNPVKSLKSE